MHRLRPEMCSEVSNTGPEPENEREQERFVISVLTSFCLDHPKHRINYFMIEPKNDGIP
jgi:hypothetical protein